LHQEFVDAYELLGFTGHAEKLKYVMSLFPNCIPQRNLKERHSFLDIRFESDGDQNKDIHEIEFFFWDNSEKVFELIDKICEDF
jgi:hypothetical protein